ncbi:hydrolase TatD family [Clostridium sp. CAG:524]|nr:hydrolase TatD family [Clostridium sp. CAG:524]
MIDTHAHILSEFYDDIDELIEELKSKNIIKVINCADSIETSKEVLNIYNKYEGYLLPAVGIHPENIDNSNLKTIENIIKEHKVFAIGEIGLDYHYNDENKDEQKEYFIKQLDLALKYDLPVIIHIREAMQECFDILKTRKNKGIIHCFSGSVEMAREYIKLGYKLGIGGVLTFKNSKLYEVIEKIDLKDIVLETDSPFLSPEPFRGKKNKPCNVLYVAKRIAEIKNISLEEVINTTTATANQIFDI